jgi:peptidoglycan lytic transglycosylase G
MRLRWLVVALALATAGFAWLVLTPSAAVRQGPLMVTIPPHEGLLGIANRLARAQVIRSRPAFVVAALVRGVPRSLKAGEYEIPRDATTLDIVVLLESGRVRQHAILHPEGATVAELARALEAENLASADAVARAAMDRKFLDANGIEAASVEGYLFPDTYQFVRGMTPDELLGKMVQRMRAKLTPEIHGRARELGLSMHQLLTLASIIEREAIVKDEQRLIAAVFWNRMKIGMPLQADPTVQYAVAKERRALSRADLAVDHPYNTYVRPGLPPGPIASPGLDAIHAALEPAPVKYLYFVARDDRRHHFSTTMQEHNSAVTRYRLSRRLSRR